MIDPRLESILDDIKSESYDDGYNMARDDVKAELKFSFKKYSPRDLLPIEEIMLIINQL